MPAATVTNPVESATARCARRLRLRRTMAGWMSVAAASQPRWPWMCSVSLRASSTIPRRYDPPLRGGCAVPPEIDALGPCASCGTSLCDGCATFELDGGWCCETCGRRQESEARELGSGLL